MKTLMHVDGTLSGSQEEKVLQAAQAHGGRFDGVSDKGAFFVFSSAEAAAAFRTALRAHSIFAREVAG